ncbi:glycosyltransferase family 4 protein [Flavobacterium sp. 28YEA47A]|uniref:glycosyltransferase family 4 protein n=1 Tax=Flavobacterium sp. 28YEA47A TaxID=3156276 RepID=UPI0035182B29
MNKQKLLIIGMVFPEPNSSAAGRRMLQLIQLFKETGYEITFASPAQDSEYEFDLELLAVQKAKISLNDESFDIFIQSLKPDIVLFDRFVIEEQFGWRVSKHCPVAIKILDTEDLHCLRLARQNAFKKKKEFTASDLFNDTAKREIASILRCDMSLIISDFEIKLLISEFKIDPSLLFYLPIFADTSLDFVPFNERKDFVFIGNFLHEPNWDAVQYLKSTIWPLIHKQLPDVSMFVYGAYPSQKVLELNHPKSNFHIMGRADNAAEVIKKTKIMLAPLRFGAGIKGKLIEAMEYGTPSVTTSIGAEGMHIDRLWNGFVTDNAEDFANHAIELYKNENLWRKAQENGLQLLEKRFAENLYKNVFIAMINGLKDNLTEHRNKNFIGQILQYHAMRSTEYMSRWIEAKNKKIPS